MGVFQQIIAGAQADRRIKEKQAFGAGEDFITSIQSGRKNRREEEAAVVIAEGKIAELIDNNIIDEDGAAHFATLDKPQDIINFASQAEARAGIQKDDADKAFKLAQIEAQDIGTEQIQKKLDASDDLSNRGAQLIDDVNLITQLQGGAQDVPIELQQRAEDVMSRFPPGQLELIQNAIDNNVSPGVIQAALDKQAGLAIAPAASPARNLNFQTIMRDGVPVKVGLDPVSGEEVKEVGEGQRVPRGPLSGEEQANVVEKVEEAKTAVRRVGEHISQGRTASSSLSGMRRSLEIIEKGDIVTGELASVKTTVKKWIKDLGFPTSDLEINSIADAEQLRALTMQNVLDLIQKTKGSISERENKMFQEASPGLKNTPEGNKRILRFLIAKGEKEVKIRRFINKLRKEKKGSREIDLLVDDFIADPKNDITNTFLDPDHPDRLPAPGETSAIKRNAEGVPIAETEEELAAIASSPDIKKGSEVLYKGQSIFK